MRRALYPAARGFLLATVLAFVLSGCSLLREKEAEPAAPLKLSAAEFSDLPGWSQDDLADWGEAFSRSCEKIGAKDPAAAFAAFPEAGNAARWQNICKEFAAAAPAEAADRRAFIETHFRPWEVRAGDDPDGLFTGYYEASLRGSRTRSGLYNIPLYARPDDLVMVDLGEFREKLKGERIAGRVINGSLKPYETRAQIVAGAWPHNDKVLVWVDDAVDAFFVQVQGSGVVDMDDGTQMRIGYAGQNGHPYYAIGRELIKRGALTAENVSMQAIRQWLAAHPQQADEIMNSNASYVFFKQQEGAAAQGAQGGQGVALTPLRSLAVDRSLLPYGAPLWVDIQGLPAEAGMERLQRLMLSQDTGGAIRGPVRGDVFWGHGKQAEKAAGEMKSQGRYWILLPR